MSYKNYTGTVSARGGKGKESPQCHADISEVIPVSLSPQELTDKLVDKYGVDICADLLWNQYKVIIQKAGQSHLKSNPKDIDGAAAAIVARANSDLIPQRRTAAPKVNAAAFRAAAEAEGVSAKKIEAILAGLLKS